MSIKNPLTLAGIEPATFRFLAQEKHLYHIEVFFAAFEKWALSARIYLFVSILLREVLCDL
jgi:hypothetical protein